MALRLVGRALGRAGRRGPRPLAAWAPRPLPVVPARRAAASAAGEEAAAEEPPGEEPPKPSAPPLSIGSELLLYESSIDLAAVAQRAKARSLLGAGLGILGWAGVLVGSAGTFSPPMQAVLVVGAVGYVYKNAVLSIRSMAGVALTHVERIVALPTGPAGTETDVTGAMSAEDRLAATPEVQLKIRTANLDLLVKLTDPVTSWQGGRYSGFVSDDRRVCGDLFDEQQRLLYLEKPDPKAPKVPSSEHAELLQAVRESAKVVAERQLELRTDVDSVLRLPPQGIKMAETALFPVVKQNQQQQAGGGARRMTPEQEITALGTQSLFSGVIFLTAGGLYLGADFAKDPNNPGKRKDVTVGDFINRMRGGGAAPGAAPAPPSQG